MHGGKWKTELFSVPSSAGRDAGRGILQPLPAAMLWALRCGQHPGGVPEGGGSVLGRLPQAHLTARPRGCLSLAQHSVRRVGTSESSALSRDLRKDRAPRNSVWLRLAVLQRTKSPQNLLYRKPMHSSPPIASAFLPSIKRSSVPEPWWVVVASPGAVALQSAAAEYSRIFNKGWCGHCTCSRRKQ